MVCNREFGTTCFSSVAQAVNTLNFWLISPSSVSLEDDPRIDLKMLSSLDSTSAGGVYSF